MKKYDVLVIGGGSGGCACSIRSADLGKKVAIIEYRDKDGIGGTCVNRGCIPTKALLRSAEIYCSTRDSKKYGINVNDCSFAFKDIMQKKKAAVNALKFGLNNFVLKSRNIEIIKGKGRIVSPNLVEVTNGDAVEQIYTDNIVVAAGSEPARIEAFNIDGENVITSDEGMELGELPGSILIIGAGAIGLEFASILSSFGTKVTIVEMVDCVAPLLRDKQLSDLIQKNLNKKGIEIITGARIENITVLRPGEVLSKLSSGKEIVTQKVLVSIGRRLNTDGLGLEVVGVETDKHRRVIVDEHMRTNIKNIYAAGDIVSGPQLSHKAQREGVVIAENIAGIDRKMDYGIIPWVIFTAPEIASVGLSHEEAGEMGIETIVGELPFTANEKANTMQETAGMVKIIAEKSTGKIIGGRIFGPEASLLIAEIALAVYNGNTVEELANLVHAHPTLAEAVMEAAKGALGIAFHPQKRG